MNCTFLVIYFILDLNRFKQHSWTACFLKKHTRYSDEVQQLQSVHTIVLRVPFGCIPFAESNIYDSLPRSVKSRGGATMSDIGDTTSMQSKRKNSFLHRFRARAHKADRLYALAHAPHAPVRSQITNWFAIGRLRTYTHRTALHDRIKSAAAQNCCR
jgi:hypothetical protein